MDPKELRGLVEAYSEVYTPQEEIKEASYSAKAARAGKDIGKPGKMFAKIAKSAAKRYGSEERGKKVAGAVLAKLRSEEIEVLEDMLDEAVKGASRHDTEMRKAAASERRSGVKNRLSPSEGRQNAAKMERDVKYMDKLTKNNKIIVGMAHEEVSVFDVVLEFLQVEGFAETLEEAEWLMANMIDEEAIGIILGEAIYSEKGKAKAAEMIANRSTPSGRAKSGKGANVAQIRQIRGSGRGRFDREGLGGTPMTPTMAKNPIKKQSYDGTGNKAARRAAALNKEAFEAWLDEAMTNYEKNRKRAAQRAAARNEARKQGKTGAVPGVGYVTPRPEKETWTDESGKTRHAKGL